MRRFNGATSYARIQEKNIPGQGRCAKKLAWPEVVRNGGGQGRAGSGKQRLKSRQSWNYRTPPSPPLWAQN